MQTVHCTVYTQTAKRDGTLKQVQIVHCTVYTQTAKRDSTLKQVQTVHCTVYTHTEKRYSTLNKLSPFGKIYRVSHERWQLVNSFKCLSIYCIRYLRLFAAYFVEQIYFTKYILP